MGMRKCRERKRKGRERRGKGTGCLSNEMKERKGKTRNERTKERKGVDAHCQGAEQARVPSFPFSLSLCSSRGHAPDVVTCRFIFEFHFQPIVTALVVCPVRVRSAFDPTPLNCSTTVLSLRHPNDNVLEVNLTSLFVHLLGVLCNLLCVLICLLALHKHLLHHVQIRL